ncbi:hypothetical protein J2X03_003607 [Microbacterium trichothecenolyticum]|uniref:DUF4862 family protein n=1 Tax=Microbacterium trichothecenolyticum TaxID=69370 RepID=UPI002855FD80|nr:DUF4862 family protein [Microbacterium trichothecenolyticum]MDR7113707.1 hypothetical protein [Microbacterium trichothecenolyticum]
MSSRSIVAAYAAASRDLADHPAVESAWYDALRAEPLIDGLELAFTTGLHPAGSAYLSRLLDDRWSLVVTNIRRTMGAAHRDPAYGLASVDEAGRSAAVRDVRLLREHIVELERPVLAVELHSAPHRGRAPSGQDQLVRSLEELLAWDWAGTKLVVEHCDAFRATETVQKGYLSLQDEITAVRALTGSGADAAIALNWGRSAIEAGSADGPEEHLAAVLRDDVPLAGFFFSGAAANDSEYGGAWRDVHLPMEHEEPTSLLTASRVRRALRMLPHDVDYIGVKVAAHPGDVGVDRLRDTLAILARIDRMRREESVPSP